MTSSLPVAPDWFRFTVVDERTTLIDEPHVRGLLRANLWHRRGRDRDLLIDCGPGVTALAPVLAERFDRDAHPLEPVDDPVPGSLYGPALATRMGLVDPLPPVLLTARPHGDYDLDTYRVRPVTPTRSLADGDPLDLGDHTLTVLHLPGHSPGSIALFDDSDGSGQRDRAVSGRTTRPWMCMKPWTVAAPYGRSATSRYRGRYSNGYWPQRRELRRVRTSSHGICTS